MVSDATVRPVDRLRLAAVASPILLHQAEADMIEGLREHGKVRYVDGV